jgi:hypothetical protein
MKPQVTDVQEINNDTQIEVTFNKNVGASALNLANYQIDGVSGTTLFSSAVLKDDTQHVVLNLKPNTITVTGSHLITVSNVQDTSGNVMGPATQPVALTENVTPTFTAPLPTGQIWRTMFEGKTRPDEIVSFP